MHKHFLKTTKPLLALVADVVAQPNIVAKVAKSGRQIVFFGVQRLTAVAEAERQCVDALADCASLGVHSVIL